MLNIPIINIHFFLYVFKKEANAFGVLTPKHGGHNRPTEIHSQQWNPVLQEYFPCLRTIPAIALLVNPTKKMVIDHLQPSLYFIQRKVKVEVAQPCLTLRDPMNYTIHGILQARILERVDFSFSRGSSQPRDWTQVSHIADGFFSSWVTREAQEYWSGYPTPPAYLPDPGIELDLLHCRWILYQLS